MSLFSHVARIEGEVKRFRWRLYTKFIHVG